jgi:AcrR family transcriptional regulator
MAQTNPDRSLATQTSILKAATALTKKNGWANTTIRGICTEAGVSIGAFYHHFSSKQELMNQAFLLFDETLNDNLPQSDMTPLKAIKDKNILSDEKKSAASPQREYYRRVLMHVRQAKDAHLFAAVYTPEYITELLIKYVRGSIIDWCLHDYSYDVVKRTEEELDILIGALTVSQR